MDELIERLEKATGPDRELDATILLAVRPGAKLRARVPYEFEFKGGYFNVPYYTGSIDAALGLVAENCSWMVSTEEPGPYAAVGESTCAYMAATPALALCIAALKAGGPNG